MKASRFLRLDTSLQVSTGEDIRFIHRLFTQTSQYPPFYLLTDKIGKLMYSVCAVHAFPPRTGVALADETATSDEDEEESKSNVFLTLLVRLDVMFMLG